MYRRNIKVLCQDEQAVARFDCSLSDQGLLSARIYIV